MKVLLLEFFSFFVFTAGKYEGYKVFDIIPRTPATFFKLEMMTKNTSLDFWVKRKVPNTVWTVMVPPDRQGLFVHSMIENSIEFSERIHDLTTVLEYYHKDKHSDEIMYDEYPNYDAILKYVESLEDEHPSIVSIMNYGHTHEGRKLFGVKINKNVKDSETDELPGIVITAGINPREWIGPITAIYIIDQLVNDINSMELRENIVWYIFPLLNPDGYEYTMSTDRLWQKSVTPNSNCIGVDISKNFDCAWGESSSNFRNPCHAEYIGFSSFSEPESRALFQFLTGTDHNIKLYLSLRAFGPAVIYPWAYTTLEISNRKELEYLGEKFNKVVSTEKISYPVDSYWSMYSVVGGMDIDWVHKKQNVTLAYSLHLPGGRNLFFDPAPSEIKKTVHKVFQGIPVFTEYILNKKWEKV